MKTILLCPLHILFHDGALSSIAIGPDDPDYPGQIGRILSGSLGYPDLTKITV